MNNKDTYKELTEQLNAAACEQLNYNINNNIGTIRGKTYYLDGKAIFAIYKGIEGNYAIFDKLLEYHDEIEYFWDKLPEFTYCKDCCGSGEIPVGEFGQQATCGKCSGTGKI